MTIIERSWKAHYLLPITNAKKNNNIRFVDYTMKFLFHRILLILAI